MTYEANPVELTELTLAQLVALYNAYAERPIRKFSDRDSGLRRTYNCIEDTGINVFAKGDAIKAELNLEECVDLGEYVATDQEVVKVKAKKTHVRMRYPLASAIKEVVSNPKRKGGLSYHRFEQYKKAKTVGEYVDQCVKFMAKRFKQEPELIRTRALQDVAYDVAKGFIKVDVVVD